MKNYILKTKKSLLIQGLPSSIEKQFIKLSYSKNVTPLLRSKKIDFALVFAINRNQMHQIMHEVMPALHQNSKLWVAFPKTTSKIVSDLNRDCNWHIFSENGYELVQQVILDHVWTALYFKKSLQNAIQSVLDESTNETNLELDELLISSEKFFSHKENRRLITPLKSSKKISLKNKATI